MNGEAGNRSAATYRKQLMADFHVSKRNSMLRRFMSFALNPRHIERVEVFGSFSTICGNVNSV